MSSTVAAYAVEMHGTRHSADTPGHVRWIAGFIGTLGNAKALSAITQHLRHERQIIEAAAFIERRQDLLAAPNFNPFPGFEIKTPRVVLDPGILFLFASAILPPRRALRV